LFDSPVACLIDQRLEQISAEQVTESLRFSIGPQSFPVLRLSKERKEIYDTRWLKTTLLFNSLSRNLRCGDRAYLGYQFAGGASGGWRPRSHIRGRRHGNDYSGEDFVVTRYNTDGTLDNTFGRGGKVRTDFPGLAAVPSSVVIQPDGKIVVAGGAFPLFTFLGNFELVRYNPNGSLDRSFGGGGIVTTTFPEGSYAFDVALQPDGKIVAAGTVFVNFDPGEPSDTDFALARYNPDGTPDATFGNGGQVSTDFVGMEDDAFSVLIQSDGKIVAVGSANDPATFYDFAAARYLSNGAIDMTFGVAGKVQTDFGDQNFDRARSAALQPDGRIVAAGFAISHGGGVQNFAVARYTSNGILDTTFSRDGKTQIDFGNCCQSATKVLLQNDGKIITVGGSSGESSEDDFLLARLNPRGSLDNTFGIGGEVRTSFGDLNGGANGAALQSDGKIVAVGFQATFSNQWANFALARYLSQ
jgi:uncharacterized delta-60 repeat protein